MPSQAQAQIQTEDMVAVRRELLDLLRCQMDVLNSGLELTDSQLRECYDRQGRVQKLREKLEECLSSELCSPSLSNEAPDVHSSARLAMLSPVSMVHVQESAAL
ncbi:MAG: hypothetical protein WAL56_09070 [Candidatus Sulfotelmatobacter sp.]